MLNFIKILLKLFVKFFDLLFNHFYQLIILQIIQRKIEVLPTDRLHLYNFLFEILDSNILIRSTQLLRNNGPI